MTSKNNSKNPVQKQDLVKRTFRLTPENDTLINDKTTQCDLSRAEVLRHCLDFCEANGEAFDAFVTGEQSESTDSVDADNSTDTAESTNSAVIEPGKPLIANEHLNSLVYA